MRTLGKAQSPGTKYIANDRGKSKAMLVNIKNFILMTGSKKKQSWKNRAHLFSVNKWIKNVPQRSNIIIFCSIAKLKYITSKTHFGESTVCPEHRSGSRGGGSPARIRARGWRSHHSYSKGGVGRTFPRSSLPPNFGRAKYRTPFFSSSNLHRQKKVAAMIHLFYGKQS